MFMITIIFHFHQQSEPSCTIKSLHFSCTLFADSRKLYTKKLWGKIIIIIILSFTLFTPTLFFSETT